MREANIRWAERVNEVLTGWVGRLPPGLRRLVPRELAGFAILGGFTFSVDLALLAALRHGTALPLAVAVSVAYLVAFGLNFVLNRMVTFRSHAPAGPQMVRYVAVLAGDFGITVGVSTGLAALGLPFPVARVAASGVVAAFTYSASRWWVFRERPAAAAAADATSTAAGAAATPAADATEADATAAGGIKAGGLEAGG